MNKIMHLAKLVTLSDPAVSTSGEVPICGITADSRKVKPGFLFAALPGNDVDGAKFIADALERGAAAVVTHASWKASVDAPQIETYEETPVLDFPNPRRELALAAARYYAQQPDTVCAVTGTNGKTSIASFARQIWSLLGLRAASLGTLGLQSPEAFMPLGHTTPDPVAIHKALYGLALANVHHLALEASSHGLTQYRLDGVKIKAAAFSNLTRDHLDYHKDFDDYLFAKMRLFGEVMVPGSVAVLNIDADFFKEADEICWSRGIGVLPVGKKEGAALRLVNQIPNKAGQIMTFAYDGSEVEIDLPLVGSFQAMNVLMAAALVMATGGEPNEVFSVLPHLIEIQGRLQHVGDTPSGGSVYVDYAHTPDALHSAIEALRPHTTGRLHVIVGCGGDRDPGKRPLMGEIAARLGDVAIITDDNPRSEDPKAIRTQMMAGAKAADGDVHEIGDRGIAISQTVATLGEGDILIVAGKGHETGQIVGDKVLPFSDVDEVRAALEASVDKETQ
jgi:UDP-N-acetylmuramoyl-L-alanyl-D-glutamate--2,6-diaminopimelate ligase